MLGVIFDSCLREETLLRTYQPIFISGLHREVITEGQVGDTPGRVLSNPVPHLDIPGLIYQAKRLCIITTLQFRHTSDHGRPRPSCIGHPQPGSYNDDYELSSRLNIDWQPNILRDPHNTCI